MKEINKTDRRVTNIYDATYKPFVSDGIEDGHVLQLNTSKPLGVGFYIYKMAPGTTTIPHKHNGDEEFLIIEGDLRDNDGTKYGPGDLVWLRDGTEHSSHTENGCLIAVYVDAIENSVRS